MKTSSFRLDWLFPLLGIALLAGFMLGATTYRKLERQVDAEVAFMPMIDRLCQDHTVSLALESLRAGQVDQAARHLDLLLCWDILRADAELASADARTRAWKEDMFRRIARARAKNADGADAGGTLEPVAARQEAQKILDLALKNDHSSLAKQ